MKGQAEALPCAKPHVPTFEMNEVQAIDSNPLYEDFTTPQAMNKAEVSPYAKPGWNTLC